MWKLKVAPKLFKMQYIKHDFRIITINLFILSLIFLAFLSNDTYYIHTKYICKSNGCPIYSELLTRCSLGDIQTNKSSMTLC